MKRIFIILKEDIINYPPVLTILNVLPKLGYKVIHIGVYSDTESKKKYEDEGIEFWPTLKYNGKAGLLTKFTSQLKYRKQVEKYLTDSNITSNDRVWIMQAETICLLNKVVEKYPCILHFYEYVEPSINWKYRLLNPLYNPSRTFAKAKKIVCCEYNRAHITKGLFQLNELPIVLPNKMVIDEDVLKTIPKDIKPLYDEVLEKVKNKKVILYQGIFLDKERRLEEFCEAIKKLSDEYVFIAMGRGSDMFDELKKKYESDRILFIPFVRPPYHLLVTKLASIGILSYFPRMGSVAYTINPIYCAPNKIFEYAKFGIPMISNDIPALKYTYMEYGCGECINYPITAEAIVATINKIFGNYEHYKSGALNYFNSVEPEKIIKEIVS